MVEKYNKLLKELLVECEEDHVGLWSIIHDIHCELGENDPCEVQQIALGLIDKLFDDPRMAAGFPADDGRGFLPWDLSKSEILSRIKNEWDVLGREPDIGDIVWFTRML
jgi:hypothetical protein